MLKGTCLCGAVTWEFESQPDGATACNCTACRRYGALWIYGHEGHDVRVAGATQPFVRGKALSFNFCPRCGCVTHWQPIGRASNRMGVNFRNFDASVIGSTRVRRFDGANTWKFLD